MHFKGISLLIVITVIVGGFLVVSAQQDMRNMPGMKMGNKGTQKKRTTTRKKPSAKKHNMANMPRMNMPMPGASPSASPMGQTPGMDTGGMNMNMGPLMVMKGNDMGIRVGSSDTNLMSMGAMGSGTSWQPSSGPMHMHYKVAGD